VVEYALSRAASPALVAEYQTRLPDKRLLQAKLHEFYELAQAQAARPALEGPNPAPAKPSRPRKGKKSGRQTKHRNGRHPQGRPHITEAISPNPGETRRA